jgi:hypothetical protein
LAGSSARAPLVVAMESTATEEAAAKIRIIVRRLVLWLMWLLHGSRDIERAAMEASLDMNQAARSGTFS